MKKKRKKTRPTTRMTTIDLRVGNRVAFRLGKDEVFELVGTVRETTARLRLESAPVGILGTFCRGVDLDITIRLDEHQMIARLK